MEDLLESVPHRLITRTVPKRIRPFFLWDRKLLGLLARCAAQTIRGSYCEMLEAPGGRPGIVTAIQTFGGRGANDHPHIHCLCTDGLFLPDGTFLPPSWLAPVDIGERFRSFRLLPEDGAALGATAPVCGPCAGSHRGG